MTPENNSPEICLREQYTAQYMCAVQEEWIRHSISAVFLRRQHIDTAGAERRRDALADVNVHIQPKTHVRRLRARSLRRVGVWVLLARSFSTSTCLRFNSWSSFA